MTFVLNWTVKFFKQTTAAFYYYSSTFSIKYIPQWWNVVIKWLRYNLHFIKTYRNKDELKSLPVKSPGSWVWCPWQWCLVCRCCLYCRLDCLVLQIDQEQRTETAFGSAPWWTSSAPCHEWSAWRSYLEMNDSINLLAILDTGLLGCFSLCQYTHTPD